MSLWPFERELPVYRSPRGFFNPSMDFGRWDDFGSTMHQMDRQMRAMERQMNDMYNHFYRLAPAQGEQNQMGMVQYAHPRQHEDWIFANPVMADKDGNRQMQLRFDVRNFKPDEIKVKTKNGVLEVEAKHELKTDNSHSFRTYRRLFTLPKDVKEETMKSIMSPEGVLTIEAPLPAGELPRIADKEHTIPIEHTKG